MWRALDDKTEFNEIEGKWFNLSTGNYVKNVPRGFVSQTDPRVVGTQEQIAKFVQMNRKDEIVIKIKDEPRPIKYKKRSVLGKFVCCFITCTKTVEIEEPEEEKEQVHEVPLLNYDSLGPFSLWGLNGKAFVISVSDGDTIDIIVKLKAEDLTRDLITCREGRNEGIQKREKRSAPCLGMTGSLYIRLNCRCNGYDAAEHDTIQGALATNALIDQINRVNRYVWFEVVEGRNEKYGRTLVNLWFDRERKHSFAEYMCSLRDQQYGPVALPYDGKTKSDYMKNLSKFSPFEISNRVAQLSLMPVLAVEGL